MKVYFASDHAGFELKNALVEYVRELGYEVEDCGAHSFDETDDYPVFVMDVARRVAADPERTRGIVIGGSGQGEAFAANRIRGVRAAVYYGEPTLQQTDVKGKKLDMISSTREHNNTNIFSLAGRFLTKDEAKDAVKRWLTVPYDYEERHERRHRMIDEEDVFDHWNNKKRATHKDAPRKFFRDGDIYSMRMGKNIGYEQDGRGVDFLRPVLVIRKFNNDVFLGVALTTKRKPHPLYMHLGMYGGRESVAILSQLRLWDAKRLDYKIGHIPVEKLHEVRKNISYEVFKLLPPASAGVGRRSDI